MLNTSSCDTKALTHVHEEDTYGSWGNDTSGKKKASDKGNKTSKKSKKQDKKNNKYYYSTIPKANADIYRSKKMKQTKKKLSGKMIGLLVSIILLTGVLEGGIELVKTIGEKLNLGGGSTSVSQQWDYDPYAYVTRELSGQGEKWKETLEPGNYVVGTDLPEGVYQAILSGGEGSMKLDDDENGIYLWQFFSEEDYDGAATRLDDLRLYTGGRLTVGDGLALKLSTDNGQTGTMTGLENPLTETVSLKKGVKLTAGEDFPSGVYDLQIEKGWGAFAYEVPISGSGDDGDYMEQNSQFMDAQGEYRNYYKNLVIPHGSIVEARDEDMILIPSSRITSENYSDYYK